MADDADKRRISGGKSSYLVSVTPETRERRLHSAPSAERNTRAILAVLRANLPETGRALELASGTGQHVAAFARAFPDIQWCPSDVDQNARESVVAWSEDSGLANINQPLDLDVLAPDWQEAVDGPVDIVLAINLIHITPWAATLGLMQGAGKLVAPGGILYLYGPYKRAGAHTAPSNEAFDDWLKSQDPQRGVRDLEAVEAEAGKHGFALEHVEPMPANNFSVVFRKG